MAMAMAVAHIKVTSATPTAIPAFAPVDSPDEFD